MQPCLNFLQSWKLHPHGRDKGSLLSKFPSDRFAPVRKVGCEHTSYSSLQHPAWGHCCPHHPSPCLFIQPCPAHCPLHSVSRTTHKYSQKLVSKTCLNHSCESRTCSQMKMCEHSLQDLSQVSLQAWQGRQLVHSLWAHTPLFQTPRVLTPKQSTDWTDLLKTAYLKGYFHYFNLSVLSKSPNSTKTWWKRQKL